MHPPRRTYLRLRRRLALGVLTISVALGCTSPPSTSGPPSQSSAAPVEIGQSPAPVDDLPQVLPDPRERALAEIVTTLLAESHLVRRPLDDSLSKDAFKLYVEQLDGAKLFLLQEHVDALGNYSDRMDDELRERDLVLARKGAALLARRREVVAKVVDELLSVPFDFSAAEEIETDAEKRAFCKNESELRDRWRGVLKLQVLERLQQMDDLLAAKPKPGAAPDPAAVKAQSAIPATAEAREAKAREELQARFKARFVRLAAMEPLEPASMFLNAVATAYDPHTQYLAPDDKANFDIAITGTLQGIGAALGEEDHFIVVRELVPGGASWQQGKLGAGDLILAVAQQGEEAVDITDMPLDKVVKMIRGPKGTVVTLTVKKPEGHIETISITRDVIKIEATYARGAVLDLGPKNDPVGYVYLPGFYGGLGGGAPGERNATDDVRSLLEAFSKKKVGSVIVDLRGNGGGLLSHARDISGLFIDKGPVVQTKTAEGELEVLSDTDPSVAFSGNVVVLVDRFSASAAEILAGALQDYERAVIVGTGPTHGKGTVQAVVELDRLKAKAGGDPMGVFKITGQQYFRVNGASTQRRGVEPDIVLPDPASFVDSGERTLPHAVAWSSVDALRYGKVPHSWVLTDLVAASKGRVQAQPTFAKVKAFAELMKARRESSREPLQRDAWFAKRKREKAEVEATDPKLKEQKPLFEVAMLEGPAAPVAAPPSADKNVKKKLDEWKDDLARDPWVAEALHVAADMSKKR